MLRAVGNKVMKCGKSVDISKKDSVACLRQIVMRSKRAHEPNQALRETQICRVAGNKREESEQSLKIPASKREALPKYAYYEQLSPTREKCILDCYLSS